MIPIDAPSIPKHLVATIRAGNCVAFVGSGYAGAAGLPTWESLLRDLASRPEAESIHAQVIDRLQAKTAHAFDEVAQALEDKLGRETVIAHLRAKLTDVRTSPIMERRKTLLRNIPFRAVLTTNFDRILKGDVPAPAAYRKLLRSVHQPWIGAVYPSPRDKRERPLLKLHGDLNHPETVVLTRRDYRRLLYENAGYLSFLRAYLLSYTVLYLGFSFTDAYVNELRSELLTRIDQREGSDPVAYAVINDVPALSRAHFRKHEGIEILSYDTRGETDFSGFDRMLEAIHDLTSPAMRYRAALSGKRLLWVDPRFEDNFRWAHEYFDMRSGHEMLDLVRTADEAVARLERPDARPYDLAICFWGDDAESATSPAVALLRALRSQERGVPVIVFAEHAVFLKIRRRALELGALGCYYRWESLLRAILVALDPESETG
jgi:hypothetical protein